MQKAVNKRMESLLKVTGITKKFQGLVAVDNVSIDMKEHTIHALIGPNGGSLSPTTVSPWMYMTPIWLFSRSSTPLMAK